MESESMGRLTVQARLLFFGLILAADDEGRERAALRVIASRVFPFDQVSDQELESWVTELEREDMIERYEVERTMYLRIVNWSKHQVIDRPSKSRIPDKPGFSGPVLLPREDSRGLASAREDSRGGADGVREGEGIGEGGERECASGSASSTPPPPKTKQDQGTAKTSDPKKNYQTLVQKLKLSSFVATRDAVEEWSNGATGTVGCKTPEEVWQLIRFCRENNPTARYIGQCLDSCDDFKRFLREERQKKQDAGAAGDLKEAV
jgi:hypothetical protein